jgi:hypothetical protein
VLRAHAPRSELLELSASIGSERGAAGERVLFPGAIWATKDEANLPIWCAPFFFQFSQRSDLELGLRDRSRPSKADRICCSLGVIDPDLDGNVNNNQQHDPIAHSPQTNLKTSDEEQSDLNTFWGNEQSTDQTINRKYSR